MRTTSRLIQSQEQGWAWFRLAAVLNGDPIRRGDSLPEGDVLACVAPNQHEVHRPDPVETTGKGLGWSWMYNLGPGQYAG
jgi:hypothetical protein